MHVFGIKQVQALRRQGMNFEHQLGSIPRFDVLHTLIHVVGREAVAAADVERALHILERNNAIKPVEALAGKCANDRMIVAAGIRVVCPIFGLMVFVDEGHSGAFLTLRGSGSPSPLAESEGRLFDVDREEDADGEGDADVKERATKPPAEMIVEGRPDHRVPEVPGVAVVGDEPERREERPEGGRRLGRIEVIGAEERQEDGGGTDGEEHNAVKVMGDRQAPVGGEGVEADDGGKQENARPEEGQPGEPRNGGAAEPDERREEDAPGQRIDAVVGGGVGLFAEAVAQHFCSDSKENRAEDEAEKGLLRTAEEAPEHDHAQREQDVEVLFHAERPDVVKGGVWRPSIILKEKDVAREVFRRDDEVGATGSVGKKGKERADKQHRVVARPDLEAAGEEELGEPEGLLGIPLCDENSPNE
ncbi:hypothetical protein OUZ56_032500 [Daphnia magna]|uniref:Uncharacterized protein n=1 Tax=Daphnia magna TaxID=35525 RepID=A0ABR0B942_9CRUS|nr:hypothetical protein OUZ56_032500 [Daphnia magna]